MPDPITGMPLPTEWAQDYAQRQQNFMQQLVASQAMSNQVGSQLQNEQANRALIEQQTQAALQANQWNAMLQQLATKDVVGGTAAANALGAPVGQESGSYDALLKQPNAEGILADMARIKGNIEPTANAVLQAGMQKKVAEIQSAMSRYSVNTSTESAERMARLEIGAKTADREQAYKIFSEGVLMTAAQEYGEFTPEMRDAYERGGIQAFFLVANKTPATRLRVLSAIEQARAAALYGHAQVIAAKSPQLAAILQAYATVEQRGSQYDATIGKAYEDQVPPDQIAVMIKARADNARRSEALWNLTGYDTDIPSILDPTNESEVGEFFKNIIREEKTGPYEGVYLDDSMMPPEIRKRGTATSAPVSYTTNVEYDDLIQEAETQYGLPPGLLKAVIHQESKFDPSATSPMGAAGLTQIMPGTAEDLGLSLEDRFDPKKSIFAGADYLAQKIKQFDGNIELGLAAYNAGAGNVIKAGGKIPQNKETAAYVAGIMENFGGGTTAPVVAEDGAPVLPGPALPGAGIAPDVAAAVVRPPIQSGLVENVDVSASAPPVAAAAATQPIAPAGGPVAQPAPTNFDEVARRAVVFNDDGTFTLDLKTPVPLDALGDTTDLTTEEFKNKQDMEKQARNGKHAREWEGFASRIAVVLPQFPGLPPMPNVTWSDATLGDDANKVAAWWGRLTPEQRTAIQAVSTGVQ
jgi:hypothetical protein